MLIGVGVGASWSGANARTIHAKVGRIANLLKPARAKLSFVLGNGPVWTKLRDHEVTAGIFPQKTSQAMRARIFAIHTSAGIGIVARAIKESNARVEIIHRLGQNFQATSLARIGGHVFDNPGRKISRAVDKI